MTEEDELDAELHRLKRPVFEPDTPPDDAVIARALKWSGGTLAILLCVAGGIVWYLDPGPAQFREVKRDTKPLEVRPPPGISIPTIHFSDITREAHITFVHENGATGEKLLPESMGGGCAFLDYNNDTFPDILFVNSDVWPNQQQGQQPSGQQAEGRKRPTMALYQNDGHGSFTDVTAEAGLDVSFYGQGVAVGDFDNDGWTDLFFSAVGPNRLYRNNHGKFEDVTAAAGVAGSDRKWSTSSAFFDYDNDGDLDLFVCNYVRWSPEIDRAWNCTLDGVTRAYCRVTDFEGTFPYLYRNEGGGKFTDVSESAGVQVKNPNTGVPVAKSLGVVPVDIDGDGWLDLVVANDTVQNFLYRNLQNGTFEEMGVKKGIALDSRTGLARGAMGLDAGFPRNDNTLAVVIGNFANEPTAFYCAECGAIDELLFNDDAVANGIGPSSLVWLKFGLFFADLDLDSRLDILVANGHIESDIQKVQKKQTYEQPPQLFWNAGSQFATEFVAIPKEKTGDDFARPIVGRGATYADIDGDGDLDVLITATGGAPRLLRNDQALGNHWLRVKLVGARCNRDAIGAVVEVESEGIVQRRLVMAARSYLSQVELPVTFGLGASKTVERVTIRWPDGSSQDVPDATVDQLLTIEQAK